MTLYRATVIDVPGDPFQDDKGADDPATCLRAEQDGALVVDAAGVIVARGPYLEVRKAYPVEPVVALDGVLLPGFVDTHVHYPQIRAIGGLGMPLLDWLEKCALPEEAKLADAAYAAAVADEFLAGLIAAGTTSALVFGSHFPAAMDVFFTAAAQSGLNITSGLVLSDRLLRPDLLTDAQTCHEQSTRLLERWHGRGRLRYAVTPRFALSASEAVLNACADLLGNGVHLTTHVNENPAEVARVGELFPGSAGYVDAYHRHGLVGPRSVFAHNVHARDPELELLGGLGAAVAHCPTSNAALGSGLFPLAGHVRHGVRVALGSDVGAGTGLFLGKEALQAYFGQQLLGPAGYPLTPAHLLYLATRAGARALGLDDRVGDLSPGREFDAVLIRPAQGTTLAVNLAAADDASDALARIFALATPADLAQVWSCGRPVGTVQDPR